MTILEFKKLRLPANRGISSDSSMQGSKVIGPGFTSQWGEYFATGFFFVFS